MFKLKLISKREKLLFVTTSVVIAFMIIYKLIITPAFKKYKELENTITKAQIDLNRANRLLKYKDRIEKTYDQLFSGKENLSSDDEIVYDVLNEVQAYVKDANLVLTDIKPQASKELQDFKVIPVDLKAEGSIVNISQFLFYLHNSPNFIKIDTFAIGLKSSTSSVLELKLSLNRFTFL